MKTQGEKVVVCSGNNLEQNSLSCQVAFKSPVRKTTQKYSHQQILETSFVFEVFLFSNF